MSIPLIRGRVFTPHDTAATTRVVVVNREMVRVHFPDKDPIGQRIRLLGDGPQPTPLPGKPAPEVWSEIIGVVGDVKPNVDRKAIPGHRSYEAFDQAPEQLMKPNGAHHGRGARSLSPNVRDIIHALDKDMRF